ncbi:MAG: hypothetical protein KAQ94_06935 [Arcobacteraceae bacterium]|nr:hypothetical protein [Arcobacteraceae bacterium]
MPKIYLTSKQLSFLILPLIIALYIFIYPKDFTTLNNQIDKLTTQQIISKKDITDAKNKSIYKDITFIKNKIVVYEKPLMKNNKEVVVWFMSQLKKTPMEKIIETKKINIEAKLIDVTKYNLQMIFNSKDNTTVVINNKIYKLYDKIDIDRDIQIVRISRNKVLLKNKKERRWLHLIP